MLPRNPVLASFVLVGWLIFKPSAWQKYTATIARHFSPHFALANLPLSLWRQAIIRHLLWVGHVCWAGWNTLFVFIFLILIDVPFPTVVFASCYTLMFSLLIGLLGSLLISVAFGIILSSLGGLLMSILIGLNGDIIFKIAENIAFAVMLSLADEINFPHSIPTQINQYALISVLTGIFIASYAGNVMQSITKTAYTHPPYRQIGSIVIGVLVSSLVIFFTAGFISILARYAAMMESGTVFSLIFDGLINGVLALAMMCIWLLNTRNWRQAIILGITTGVLLSLFTWLMNIFINSHELWMRVVTGLHGGIENAFLYTVLFAFPYVLARQIANPWAGIIAGVFGSAGAYVVFVIIMQHYEISFILMLVLGAFLLGMSASWWRPIIWYPLIAAWNLLLHHTEEKHTDQQPSLLNWHSAFWDEHQPLPLFGLESYLVLVAERHPEIGRSAIAYLSATAQSWAAQEAQIELDARQLQGCDSVEKISGAYHRLAAGELKGPASALLRSFSRLSRDVEAALAQESNYNQRLALDAIEERLDGLLRELTRSSELYAQRFRPIAEIWRQTLADYAKALTEAVESRQEINNPYIIGIPLTEHQEIFVGRSDVSANIEQLLLDRRCPPLLLYGQRRTGKTSLLNNLGKLLPSTIIPLFVDLQGPSSLARDYSGFLYNISRAMLTSAKRHRDLALPALDRHQLREDPFTTFDEWLDTIEQSINLESTILLTLDEFSALEHVFNKGVLDEHAVLGMFRHIIQHRPRFKLLLSGSHTIDEFERWASYLINVQTVHLSYLQTNEALQLIEQPVKDFALRYQPQATKKVMEITHCHPALVQLLCAEIVRLKNNQPISERRLAQIADVEAAIPGALQHGRFFFADIANNQVWTESLKILQFIAQRGDNKVISRQLLETHFPELDNLDNLLANLLQRELIEQIGDSYRFQIELIRRWFI